MDITRRSVADFPAGPCLCTYLHASRARKDVRAATGLPVFDAITAADFFMSAVQDNVRFGKQGWQEASDTVPDEAFVLDSRR